jgi:hypothetical protein
MAAKKSIPGVTENAVVINPATGEQLFPNVQETQTEKGRKQSTTVDYRTASGEVCETPQVLLITNVEDAKTFINMFKKLGDNPIHNVTPKNGYDRYYNNHGPTNPESPNTLKVEGLAKNLLVFLNAMHEAMAQGSPQERQQGEKLLEVIFDYSSVAADAIRQRTQTNLKIQLARSGDKDMQKSLTDAGVVWEATQDATPETSQSAPKGKGKSKKHQNA